MKGGPQQQFASVYALTMVLAVLLDYLQNETIRHNIRKVLVQ